MTNSIQMTSTSLGQAPDGHNSKKDKHVENQTLGLLIFVQHTFYQAMLGKSAKKSLTKQLEYRP